MVTSKRGRGATKRGRALAIPRAIRAAAERLSTLRGVIGVFWGAPRRNGKTLDERCIVVHVRRKRPVTQLGAERIPKRIQGVRTDVIAVPRLSHHWLDPSDPAQCEDAARGASTITALAKTTDAVYAVLSGHGTLPVENGQLPSAYDPATPMAVRALDPQGAAYDGQLQAGRLDAYCDFTLARMTCSADDVNPYHYAAGSYPPLVVRANGMHEHDDVAHYSSVRRRRMTGRVLHVAFGFTYVPGYGNQSFPYRDVVVVESLEASEPFSIGGDSGSLVVDGKGRIVGTVVGGDPAANLSYVLPIDATVDALGAYADRFFQPEDP